MERIRIYKDTSLKCLLEKVECALLTMHTHVNSPLAYNLAILATVADATHLRKVLEATLKNWMNRLPFLGEEGTDVDWTKTREHLNNALGEFMEQKSNHRPAKVNISCTPPERIENWRNWRNDYLDKEPRINSHSYKKELNPIEQDNLWCFVTNDYSFSNEIPYDSSSNMLVFLRNMMEEQHGQIEKVLFYEMERILKVTENLEALLRTPSKIIISKEKRDSLIDDFLSRMQTTYEFKANLEKEDYMTLRETFQDDISLEFLQQQKMLYWKKVVDSGFLENLKENYPNIAGEDEYMSRFFDDTGFRKRFVGCYIYTQQLKCANWQDKVEKFMIFAAVKDMIDEDMKQLEHEKGVGRKATEKKSKAQERYESIAHCILLLMEEKDADAPVKKLFRQNNQWIAVHRVLSNYYGFAEGYTEFVEQMEDLPLGNADYPCTLDGVMRIPLGVLAKPFEEWAKYKEKKNPRNKVFLKQYHVAVRLLDILEKEGVDRKAED